MWTLVNLAVTINSIFWIVTYAIEHAKCKRQQKTIEEMMQTICDKSDEVCRERRSSEAHDRITADLNTRDREHNKRMSETEIATLTQTIERINKNSAKQSARIVELIELCDKLQPDLVGVKVFGEDNTYPNALRFMQECYYKPHDIAQDGKVWIDECNKVDFSQLEKMANIKKEREEYAQRFERAKKFYKATTGKDI